MQSPMDNIMMLGLVLLVMGLFPSNHHVNGSDIPTSSTPAEPQQNSSSPPFIELTRITYHGFTIRIFTDFKERNPLRFFYDPVVELDPMTIKGESHSFLQKNVVSFNIEMWNHELRWNILAHLRSLGGFSKVVIGEEDIHVLPFETIQMGHKKNTIIHPSVQLMNESKPYLRQSQSLQFHILCNSTEDAQGFVQDFRQNPAFVVDSLQLYLKCYGLDLGKQIGNGHKYNMFPKGYSLNGLHLEPKNEPTEEENKYFKYRVSIFSPTLDSQQKLTQTRVENGYSVSNQSIINAPQQQNLQHQIESNNKALLHTHAPPVVAVPKAKDPVQKKVNWYQKPTTSFAVKPKA